MRGNHAELGQGRGRGKAVNGKTRGCEWNVGIKCGWELGLTSTQSSARGAGEERLGIGGAN